MLDSFLNKPKKNLPQKMEVQGDFKQASLVPWVQKYRPNKLDEITYQEEVTDSLRNVLKTGNLPHLLFYGPAGTGKTSAIVALSKELYGPKFYKERTLELNASDERGISVVREKVKNFAQGISAKNPDKNYPCPNYKIVILDEADQMTRDAQSALRRVIEDNSSNTRFCIICNYITKIIEPVASRCVKFRFKPIPTQIQLSKLEEICNAQKVKLNREDLLNLLEKGDLRQSINSLQSMNRLNTIPSNLLPTPIQFCQDLLRQVINARDIRRVYQISKQTGYQEYPMDELLVGLVQVVASTVKNQRKKAIMMEALSKAEEKTLQGSNDVQLAELLTSLYYISHTNF